MRVFRSLYAFLLVPDYLKLIVALQKRMRRSAAAVCLGSRHSCTPLQHMLSQYGWPLHTMLARSSSLHHLHNARKKSLGRAAGHGAALDECSVHRGVVQLGCCWSHQLRTATLLS